MLSCRGGYREACFDIGTAIHQLNVVHIHLQRSRAWYPRKAAVRFWRNTTKTFQYLEPVHQNFDGRHAVDDYKYRHHAPVLLEDTWGTEWWSHRNMAWLLRSTEVDVNLGQAYMSASSDAKPPPQL